MPDARPALVSPAQAEGEVRRTRGEDLVEGSLKKLFAVEPVMVVTETVEAVSFGHIGLRLADLGNAQVVEPQVGGQVWLVMPPEERAGSCHVRPLGKAIAPPCIVLRDGVVLGEVEGDQSRRKIIFNRHWRRSKDLILGGKYSIQY